MSRRSIAPEMAQSRAFGRSRPFRPRPNRLCCNLLPTRARDNHSPPSSPGPVATEPHPSTYTWYVVAKTNAGVELNSDIWTFTTAPAGFIPSAAKYSREYVRLGGRLIAIEDPPLTIRTLTGPTTVASGGSLTVTATLTGAA